MWKIAFRGFKSSLVRYLLTLLSVALGVAFLSTTLALRDGIEDQFKQITASTINDDLYVVGTKISSDNDGDAVQSLAVRHSLPDTLADEVKDVPGVGLVYPLYQLSPQMRDMDNNVLGKLSYAPTILIGQKDDTNYERADLIEGRWADKGDEVIVEKSTAKQKNLHVGDEFKLVFDSLTKTVKIVGIVDYHSTMAGASVIEMRNSDLKNLMFEIQQKQVGESVRQKVETELKERGLPDSLLAQAVDKAVKEAKQKAAEKPLSVSDIAIDFRSGTDATKVKKDVEQALAKSWKKYDISAEPEVLTRDQKLAEQNESINTTLGFVNTFLLIFVAIALFVGSFIISNTFRMIVAHQQRQFAMLRAIGVSVAQVFLIVISQGLLIGLLGSGAGLGFAFGFVAIIRRVLGNQGLLIESLPITSTNMLVAFTVGVLVTLIGAVLPARSAAKIPPVEAMRQVEGANQKRWSIAQIIGLLLGIIGVVMMAYGANLATSHPGWLLGAGALT